MMEAELMSLRDLPGQKKLGARLIRLAAQRPGGLVFLFWGPRGAAKRAAAQALAAACLCPRGEEGEPCRNCPSCLKIRAGSHPDLILLEPEKGKKKIAIESAREVIKRLTYPPLEGDRRVVMIPEADTLSAEAANALLKTLEEPPGDTLTILTTSEREALPVTVLSRCQSFLFPQPEEDWLLERVAERMSLDRDTARLMSVLAQGDLEAACALDREKVLAGRERVVGLLSRRPGETGADRLFDPASEVADKAESTQLFLDLYTVCLRDLLLAAETGETGEAVNRDLAAELGGLARQRSARDWADRLEAVLAARSALNVYANQRLTLEALMLRLSPEVWENS